jgi:probable phosphoglycerate mutase
VAVVAHADVIKAALAHYLDMPFDSFQKLGVQPASVSTVMIMTDDKTGQRRVMVNGVNHMPYAS